MTPYIFPSRRHVAYAKTRIQRTNNSLTRSEDSASLLQKRKRKGEIF
jgi:hypothetical protein